MDFEITAIKEINSKIDTEISSIIFDGQIHRFGHKNQSWYKAYIYNQDGKNYYYIRFGNWKKGIKYDLKSWENKNENNGFNNLMEEKLKQQKEKSKKENEEKYQKCIEKWLPIWEKAQSNILHGYLKSKSVSNPFCSRIETDDVLLIPAYNKHGFVGVQRIFKLNGEYVKRFSFGMNKNGAICPLKKFKNSKYCYLAEGYATASTIQEIFNDVPVIVSFDAGNICNAIKTIREINPFIKIIIAADNDIESKTGLKYAQKAVRIYSDVSYRLPVFNTYSSLTDFNDLYVSEGKQKVMDILKI